MLLYMAVKQSFDPGPPLVERMKTFRLMVNDCIRLGFECEQPSYTAIKSLCYDRMLAYPIENSYRVSAMFEASNLLKKFKNAPGGTAGANRTDGTILLRLPGSGIEGGAGHARRIRLGFNGLRAR